MRTRSTKRTFVSVVMLVAALTMSMTGSAWSESHTIPIGNGLYEEHNVLIPVSGITPSFETVTLHERCGRPDANGNRECETTEASVPSSVSVSSSIYTLTALVDKGDGSELSITALACPSGYSGGGGLLFEGISSATHVVVTVTGDLVDGIADGLDATATIFEYHDADGSDAALQSGSFCFRS